MAKGFRNFPPQVVPTTVWRGRKAALKSHGAADDDPRVVECDQWLAYHRVWEAIQADAPNVSTEGLQLLVSGLAASA